MTNWCNMISDQNLILDAAARGVNEFKQILMEIYGCITLYSDTDIGGLECCTNLDAKT